MQDVDTAVVSVWTDALGRESACAEAWPKLSEALQAGIVAKAKATTR